MKTLADWEKAIKELDVDDRITFQEALDKLLNWNAFWDEFQPMGLNALRLLLKGH